MSHVGAEERVPLDVLQTPEQRGREPQVRGAVPEVGQRPLVFRSVAEAGEDQARRRCPFLGLRRGGSRDEDNGDQLINII